MRNSERRSNSLPKKSLRQKCAHVRSSASGPLAGISVIELSTVVMGPWAAKVLADFGADVIKIEAPDGDIMRRTVPQKHDGMGAVFLNINRGKRSITLDLKTAEGRSALLKLCAKADVFVHNVRPEAMRRLGLGYDDVRAANPKIIYASLMGFSQDGPYAKRAAYDDLIQGACGLASLVELVLSDHLGGSTFVPAHGPMGYARTLTEYRRPYRTSDGYVSVLLYNED